ncbi:MAG: PLP-dependent transferase, partial [Endomicrobium sp.]|nr:PLP-dependent transferase [Endomicrobium sp.]
GYEINKKQAKGAGAMISFQLSPEYNLAKLCRNLKMVAFAESLGGVESLICHPASMTHVSVPKETREKIGINDNLLRLSVGIEYKKDIVEDLKQAFKKAKN